MRHRYLTFYDPCHTRRSALSTNKYGISAQVFMAFIFLYKQLHTMYSSVALNGSACCLRLAWSSFSFWTRTSIESTSNWSSSPELAKVLRLPVDIHHHYHHHHHCCRRVRCYHQRRNRHVVYFFCFRFICWPFVVPSVTGKNNTHTHARTHTRTHSRYT